ncbi:APG12-domain-containing protein [Trichoderma longibrachiatum ATCC 18648]|uniref:Ubiquitin-like protein ATG12 n=1 Tax=Trichoderma longibrachiatum ATCC 18648 TaxID=983965 RepID=A0A2T4C554_TRILO|nr:APG12-domain-containing protein [Trichoderma longibrachiatum ATCC 18648]
MDPAFLSPPSPSPPPLASPEDADITNTTSANDNKSRGDSPSTSNRNRNSSNSSNSSRSRSGAASPEIPLTLSASVMLADLPRDATAALASAGEQFSSAAHGGKVVVKFKAVGSAPALQQDVCKISAGRKFEEVVRYLRRKLRCGETESVFLYVNSAFAPSLDEVVGNLHQCFKNAHDQLVVAYSITPAFG